eukprot:4394764-Prymnesium_polylepis.1
MLVLLAFIDGEREKSCGFCATVVRHKRVPLVGERRENRRVGQQDAIVHADRDAALHRAVGRWTGARGRRAPARRRCR